jgi:hypothetical protein
VLIRFKPPESPRTSRLGVTPTKVALSGNLEGKVYGLKASINI